MSQRLPSLAGNGSQLTGEGARDPWGSSHGHVSVARAQVLVVGTGRVGLGRRGGHLQSPPPPPQTALVLGAGLCREGQKPGREGPSLPWRPLAQGGVVPGGPCLGGPQAEEEKQPLRELRMGL